MVAQVYGKIADKTIIFDRDEKGLWKATVPFSASGKYVVSLYATDEAGNEAYYATILYTLDIESLTVNIYVIDYAADVSQDYEAVILDNGYSACIVSFEPVKAGDDL